MEFVGSASMPSPWLRARLLFSPSVWSIILESTQQESYHVDLAWQRVYCVQLHSVPVPSKRNRLSQVSINISCYVLWHNCEIPAFPENFCFMCCHLPITYAHPPCLLLPKKSIFLWGTMRFLWFLSSTENLSKSKQAVRFTKSTYQFCTVNLGYEG